jgi:hypothetical protein
VVVLALARTPPPASLAALAGDVLVAAPVLRRRSLHVGRQLPARLTLVVLRHLIEDAVHRRLDVGGVLVERLPFLAPALRIGVAVVEVLKPRLDDADLKRRAQIAVALAWIFDLRRASLDRGDDRRVVRHRRTPLLCLAQ